MKFTRRMVFFALSSLTLAHASLGAPAFGYRGLESLDGLDQWFVALQQGQRVATSISPKGEAQLTDQILGLYQSSENPQTFLNALLAAPEIAHRLQSGDEAQSIAHSIETARARIKAQGGSLQTDLLLEFLVSETLYAGSDLKGGSELWTHVHRSARKGECQDANGRLRVGELNGLEICEGDVLSSKGGAGSSSFLARINPNSVNISHSALPWVDPSTHELSLIEAWIEDGVKLRHAEDPKAEYVSPAKTRTSVYRHKSGKASENRKFHAMLDAGVDAMVSEMYSRVKDPYAQAAYSYDFNFDTQTPDQMYCSEVVYQGYRRAGFSADENPFPRAIWTDIQSAGTRELLRDFLKIPNVSFPAPSDIAASPDYDLVSIQYNVPRIGKDRINLAMVDVLLEMLEAHAQEAIGFINQVNLMGDLKINLGLVDQLVQLKILSEEEAKMVRSQVISEVPEGISIRQVLFFGVLDKKLAPVIQARIGDQKLGPIALRGKVAQELKSILSDLESQLQKVREAHGTQR